VIEHEVPSLSPQSRRGESNEQPRILHPCLRLVIPLRVGTATPRRLAIKTAKTARVKSARAHNMGQNSASFCRVELALPSAIQGRVAQARRQNDSIMSPPRVFGTFRQNATDSAATTYESKCEKADNKTPKNLEHQTHLSSLSKAPTTKVPRSRLPRSW
jgi:hypothetical protein